MRCWPCKPRTPPDVDGMATRIKELEAQREEADKQHAGAKFDGMAARIKSLVAMLEENKEDADLWYSTSPSECASVPRSKSGMVTPPITQPCPATSLGADRGRISVRN